MILELSKERLSELTIKQLNNFFFDVNASFVNQAMDNTLERLDLCLQSINNKYCNRDSDSYFSPYNSSQYTLYLYFLSNTIFRMVGRADICDKLYYLNKIMNGVDWYYEINLPTIFFVEHPIGSVLGRAVYSDYLFFYQGITIGGNNGRYPILGDHIIIYSNASILGNCTLGNNIIVSSNCKIIDENIPSNSIVFGSSPNLSIITKSQEYIELKTKNFWKI